MEIVSSTYIHKMFDSVILEAPYGAEYTTVLTVGLRLVVTGSVNIHIIMDTLLEPNTIPAQTAKHFPILVIIKFTIPLVMRKYIL